MTARQATYAMFAMAPIRLMILGLLRILSWTGRLASIVRTAAIFPRAVGLVCHWSVEIKYPNNIALGGNVIIGPDCTLGAAASISLGGNVRLSRGVVLETAGLDFRENEPPYIHMHAPIQLEDGVWVGARAMILGGVTIGRNAVVAAGSIVTKDVPPGAIVAGVPARPIREA